MRTRMVKQAVAVLSVVAICGAFPSQIYKQATSPGAFIGEGINHIATALLQDEEKQGNAAFSPLGHSAILAALAEGAAGRTRAQILAALKLPQDSSLTRATYRSVLGRMREKNAVSKPEFRSWFYVYKKSAQVEESYTNILRDNYLMEVRDIEAAELDTPTEFFTNKDQEKEDEQKVDTIEPTEDDNKVSTVPIAEAPVVPVSHETVPGSVASPAAADSKPSEEAPVLPSEPPKPLPVLEAVPVTPVVVADEKPATTSQTADEEKDASAVQPSQEVPSVGSDIKTESDSSKEPIQEGSAPAAEGTPVNAEVVKTEPEKVFPASEEPAIQEETPKEPVMAEEISPKKDAPPAVEIVATSEVPPPAAPEEPAPLPAQEAVPTNAPAAEPTTTLSSQDDAQKVTPVKESVKPAVELLPPIMEEPAKQGDAIEAHDMPQKQEPAAESSQPDISAGSPEAVPQPSPIKEQLNEAVEEEVGKISLAKFSKHGASKDEKKPTNASKADKKKDEKKKTSRNSGATDGRQPASGPSLLTAFNALYYKGTWQTPFDAKFRDDFFVSDTVKKEVTMLRTQGEFRIGDIKELDATAIELPYKGEGGRYSLLVLLPHTRDGLAKMTEALSQFSFRQLAKSMRQKQVDVALPEFEIDCITHPQSVFRKLGVTAMLEKDGAEFPGISKAQRLFLQDDAMAQLVRFRLDDKTAVANYLSTMSMTTRGGFNVFQANHPFIFYLRDNMDNLTVVVGRVVDPSSRPEQSALAED